MSTVSFKKVIATIALVAPLFAQGAAASELATTAEVYLYSQPGSYVGGGIGAQQVTWVHGIDGIFESASNYGAATSGIDITYDDGNYWNFQFSAPTYDPATNTNNGQVLHDGLYTNAQRLPFNSPTKPGMTISGDRRGDDGNSGWFDVLDIAYNPDGSLETFAVNFEQFDTGHQTGPALYGSLRFNSSIPVNPVPLPASLWLLLGGALCAGLLLNPRRANLAPA
jgi:hypothetical protein